MEYITRLADGGVFLECGWQPRQLPMVQVEPSSAARGLTRWFDLVDGRLAHRNLVKGEVDGFIRENGRTPLERPKFQFSFGGFPPEGIADIGRDFDVKHGSNTIFRFLGRLDVGVI